MAVTNQFIINEALCFVSSKFNKTVRTELSCVLVEFYNFEEIVAAKKHIHEFAASLNVDYAPRYTERKGENRLRTSVDDLLNLFALLDVNKAKLPQFVAANLSRLPTLTVDSSAVSELGALVRELRQQVEDLSKKVDDMKTVISGATYNAPPPPPLSLPLPRDGSMPVHHDADETTRVKDYVVEDGAVTTIGTSWAKMASTLTPNSFRPRIPQPAPPRRGTGHANGNVKAVPRPLTCFVGRLDPATTADQLCQYLAEVGIMDANCLKLKTPSGRVFNTAAFRVSCREEFRHLFYDEANWPEGAELRDWIFKPRNG